METVDDDCDNKGVHFVKIADPAAAYHYGITTLPTLVYFKNSVPNLFDGECFKALWFNRGMGPKIQGFISGLFSTVCIDRLCQGESMMVTLSPGLKQQSTVEKTQQI